MRYRKFAVASLSTLLVFQWLLPLSVRAFELDLTSAERYVPASQALGEQTHAEIDVGGTARVVKGSDHLTPAEFVALSQVLRTGMQSLQLSEHGTATSGSFTLEHTGGAQLSSLVIAPGVNVLRDFGAHGPINVSGDIANYGNFYAYSTNPEVLTASITGQNFLNAQGALITSNPSALAQFGIMGAVPSLSLSLVARDTFTNAGIISSAAALSVAATTSISNLGTMQAVSNLNLKAPEIINQGLIASQLANINLTCNNLTNSATMQALLGNIHANVLSSSTLNVAGTNGSMEALNRITFGTGDYGQSAVLSVFGGDFEAARADFEALGGMIDVRANSISADVYLVGADAIVGVQNGSLTIKESNLSNDPVFFSVTGPLDLTAAQLAATGGGQFIAVSGGDVTATTVLAPTILDASSATTVGGQIVIGAGVTFNPTTFAITGSSATGGQINLPTVSLLTNSQNVNLIANAGTTGSGNITIGNITASGHNSAAQGVQGGAGGNVNVIAAGSVSTGNIITTGGAGVVGAAGAGGTLLSPSGNDGDAGTVGGPGGHITIHAGTTINSQTLTTNGGAGGDGGGGGTGLIGNLIANATGGDGASGGIGGTAGSIDILANGNVVLGTVNLIGGIGGIGGNGGTGGPSPFAGGTGGSGGAGASGGVGGHLNAVTQGLLQTSNITASSGHAGGGGSGGNGGIGAALHGGAGGFGGMGGNATGTAGSILLTASGITTGSITANGGNGGHAGNAGNGGFADIFSNGAFMNGGGGRQGGFGGSGGDITLKATTGSILTNSLSTNGGLGGNGGHGGFGGSLLQSGVPTAQVPGDGGDGGRGGGGGSSGRIVLKAAQAINSQAISLISGNGGLGGDGGSGGNTINGYGGFGGAGADGGIGGNSGLLDAAAGSISLSNLDTHGGAGGAGGFGGNGGNSTGLLYGHQGKSGGAGLNGGNGGDITLTANTSVSINNVVTNGGAGGSGGAGGVTSALTQLDDSSGNGGAGGYGGRSGAVHITAGTTLSVGTVGSMGGLGGGGGGGADGGTGIFRGADGGAGGAAGSGGDASGVSLFAGGNLNTGAITLMSGAGGHGGEGGHAGSASSGGNAGSGGAGGRSGISGDISLRSEQGSITSGNLGISTGNGGVGGGGGSGGTGGLLDGGYAGGAGVGGDAGKAGSIYLTAGSFISAGTVTSFGGLGGAGGSGGGGGSGTTVGRTAAGGGKGGDGGGSGNIWLTANTTLSLSAVQSAGGTGGIGNGGGNGGSGGDAGYGGPGGIGGSGGNSASIALFSVGNMTVNGSINSIGGNGNNGGAGGAGGAGDGKSAGDGGAGGNGGSSDYISLVSSGVLTLNGNVESLNGNGGNGGNGNNGGTGAFSGGNGGDGGRGGTGRVAGTGGAGGSGAYGLFKDGHNGSAGAAGTVLFNEGSILAQGQTVSITGTVIGASASFVTNANTSAPILVKPLNARTSLTYGGGNGLSVGGTIRIDNAPIILQSSGDLNLSAISPGGAYRVQAGVVQPIAIRNIFADGAFRTLGTDLVIVASQNIVSSNSSPQSITTASPTVNGHIVLSAGTISGGVAYGAANPFLITGANPSVPGGSISLQPPAQISLIAGSGALIFAYASGSIGLGGINAGSSNGSGSVLFSAGSGIATGPAQSRQMIYTTNSGNITGIGTNSIFASYVKANSATGNVFLANNANISTLMASSAGPAGRFEYQAFGGPSVGALKVIGAINAADIVLSTTGKVNLLLGAPVTGTNRVTLHVEGSAAITQTAGTVSSSNLTLQAGSGTIGTGAGLNTVAPAIRSSSSGLVRINNTGGTTFGPITAGDFFITDTAGVTFGANAAVRSLSVVAGGNVRISGVVQSAETVDVTTSVAGQFLVDNTRSLTSANSKITIRSNNADVSGSVLAPKGLATFVALNNSGLLVSDGSGNGVISASTLHFDGLGGPVNASSLFAVPFGITAVGNGIALTNQSSTDLYLGDINGGAGSVSIDSIGAPILRVAGQITGSSVFLTSIHAVGEGVIGSNRNILVSAANLSVAAGNGISIKSLGSINILNATTTAPGATLAIGTVSSGSITISGIISSAGGMINLQADGAGSINQGIAGMLTADTVQLHSATGNIGLSAAPVLTAAGIIEANTGGAGVVAINQTGNVTLLDSTAGDSFEFTSDAHLQVNGDVDGNSVSIHSNTLSLTGVGAAGGNITGHNGSVLLQADTGTLNIAAGRKLLANEGDLTIQNNDVVGGSIVIGANAQITARTVGAVTGLLNVVIGPVPVAPDPGILPANVTLNATNGGLAFFGVNGINALAPNNIINSDAGEVVFNTDTLAATAIQLGGGTVFSSKRGQPVVPFISSLDLTNPLAVNIILLLQAEGHVGGALTISGGIATGGDAFINPRYIAPSLSAVNIPANVSITFDAFHSGTPLNVNLTGASTTPEVLVAGSIQFTGAESDGIININSTGIATGLMLATTGTIDAAGSLQLVANRNAIFDASVSASDSLFIQLTGTGEIVQNAGSLTGSDVNLNTNPSLGTIVTPLAVNADILTLTSLGDVFVQASSDLTLKASSAGDTNTFQLNNGGFIQIDGGVGSLVGRLDSITLSSANAKIGRNSGNGILSATNVNLTAATDIGGTGINHEIVTATDDISLNGIFVLVQNIGDINVQAASADALGLITANNGSITIENDITASTITTLIADGTGSIQSFGARILTSALNVTSGSGDIGFPLYTSANIIRANTGGSVSIDTSNTGITETQSTAGTTFEIFAAGGLTGSVTAPDVTLVAGGNIGSAGPGNEFVLSTSSLLLIANGSANLANDQNIHVQASFTSGALALSTEGNIVNDVTFATNVDLRAGALHNRGAIIASSGGVTVQENGGHALALTFKPNSIISAAGGIAFNPDFAAPIATTTFGSGFLSAQTVSFNGGNAPVLVSVDAIDGSITATGSEIVLSVEQGTLNVSSAIANSGALFLSSGGNIIVSTAAQSLDGNLAMIAAPGGNINLLPGSIVSGHNVLAVAPSVAIGGAIAATDGSVIFQTDALSGNFVASMAAGSSVTATRSILFNPAAGNSITVAGPGVLSASQIEFEHGTGVPGSASVDVLAINGRIDTRVGYLHIGTSVGNLVFGEDINVSSAARDLSGGSISIAARGGAIVAPNIYANGTNGGTITLQANSFAISGAVSANGYSGAGGAISITSASPSTALSIGPMPTANFIAGDVSANGVFGGSIRISVGEAGLDVQSGAKVQANGTAGDGGTILVSTSGRALNATINGLMQATNGADNTGRIGFHSGPNLDVALNGSGVIWGGEFVSAGNLDQTTLRPLSVLAGKITVARSLTIRNRFLSNPALTPSDRNALRPVSFTPPSFSSSTILPTDTINRELDWNLGDERGKRSGSGKAPSAREVYLSGAEDFDSTTATRFQSARVVGSVDNLSTLSLRDGALLLAMDRTTSIQTPHGKLNLQAGAVVFVFADSERTVVLNLFDRNAGDVTFKSSSSKLQLLPGDRLFVGRGELADANHPYTGVATRDSTKFKIGEFDASISEFSMVSAIARIQVVGQVVNDKNTSSVANKILKTSVILSMLRKSKTAFKASI